MKFRYSIFLAKGSVREEGLLLSSACDSVAVNATAFSRRKEKIDYTCRSARKINTKNSVAQVWKKFDGNPWRFISILGNWKQQKSGWMLQSIIESPISDAGSPRSFCVPPVKRVQHVWVGDKSVRINARRALVWSAAWCGCLVAIVDQ